jgi:glycosyltransferase involved in cell wall biosynthesis
MKDNKPLISVIMPLYNSESTLRETLKALYCVDYPKSNIEIIFSYYPSEDETLKIIEEFKNKYERQYFSIKILECKKRGVSHGRNIAIMSSNAEYVFILDDDVIIHKDTFKRAMKILEERPEVAVVSYLYLHEEMDLFEEAFARARLAPFKNEVAKTKSFGGCALVRKKVFDEVGLYNEQLGYPYSHHEDIEISGRISRLYSIVVDRGLIQKHLRKRTLRLSTNKEVRFSMLKRAINGLRFYFGDGADSYHVVLRSAPIAWKLELLLYFIIPLPFIIALVLRHYLMGLIYILALLFASVIYYGAFNIKDILLIIVVILGRITRSYGYVARRLLKVLKSRILS